MSHVWGRAPRVPNELALEAMLQEARFAVHERRLYVAGFSGTARATWEFAMRRGLRAPDPAWLRTLRPVSGPATRNSSRCTARIEFIDPPLRARLNAVLRDGRTLWERFDRQVRSRAWHPFVPADYEAVLEDLLPHRGPGRRFLEMGSATGVITIMADLLGFEACGIEIDAELVDRARSLARRHGSGARFATGSYLPDGYTWRSSSGDERLGTIARGEAAYGELGHDLSDFDVVFAYPWYGDAPVLQDLVARRGAPGATLLLHDHPPGTAAALRSAGAAGTIPSRPRGDRCESSE